jgi:hypothetical protein
VYAYSIRNIATDQTLCVRNPLTKNKLPVEWVDSIVALREHSALLVSYDLAQEALLTTETESAAVKSVLIEFIPEEYLRPLNLEFVCHKRSEAPGKFTLVVNDDQEH